MSPFLYLLITDTENLHEDMFIGLTGRYKRYTLTELKAVLELIIQLTIKLLSIIHLLTFNKSQRFGDWFLSPSSGVSYPIEPNRQNCLRRPGLALSI
jgi:hypothetical protein